MKQIIGIDLSVLDRASNIGPSTHVTPECPGAYIRVNLDDYKNFRRNKMVFQEDETYVPSDGSYVSVRAMCNSLVQRIPEKLKGPDGQPYESVPVRYYGLCVHCSAIERVNRDTLKKRFAPEPKVGGR